MAKDKRQANGIDSFLENEKLIGLKPLVGPMLTIFSKDKEMAEEIIGGS
ncbi:MAG: hypothetical protein H7258_14230 [Ferruginibacter sp.]|nr:hypothetical protein [Ferruginibacter sp.]